MKKVNTCDWVEFSRRRNSVNYFSKDNELMLKVLLKNNSLKELEKEKHYSDIVESLGILTPKAYEVVENEDGNYGIIYQNIKNKLSLSRIVAANPESMREHLKEMSCIAKKLHSIQCDTNVLPDFQRMIKDGLIANDIYPNNYKEILLQILDTIEPQTTCIHGDLQPSNIIMADGKYYLIDFDMLSYGNPIFDIPWFHFLCYGSTDIMKENLLKCNNEMADRYWNVFSREYYGTDNPEFLAKEEIRLNALLYLILVPRIIVGQISDTVMGIMLNALPETINRYKEAFML